jgi:hypothetical protein
VSSEFNCMRIRPKSIPNYHTICYGSIISSRSQTSSKFDVGLGTCMRTSLNKRDSLPTAFGRIVMHVPRARQAYGYGARWPLHAWLWTELEGLRQVELALAAWCLVNHLISVFLVVTTNTTWNPCTDAQLSLYAIGQKEYKFSFSTAVVEQS